MILLYVKNFFMIVEDIKSIKKVADQEIAIVNILMYSISALFLVTYMYVDFLF